MLINHDFMRMMRTGRQLIQPINRWRAEESRDAIRGLRIGIIISVIGWGIILFMCSLCHAEQNWTDEEIVNAIYKAEGGSRAQFPYGIRSVSCESELACREVAKRTVKNNRKRFSQYGHKKHPDFISFLGSRFCPTSGRNLSKAERNLNGNWKKNVMYFLEKNRSRRVADLSLKAGQTPKKI